MRSSSSLEELDSLFLKACSCATDCSLSLSGCAVLQLLEVELLFLSALEKVDLDGVVVVDEQPAAGVDEEPAVALGEVTVASSDILHVDLAGGAQIHTGDRAVADGNQTLVGLHIHAGEAVEVLEESSIRGSHGQLNLGELREDTEETHLGLGHHHLTVNLVGRGLSEHFLYYLF
jgi:hypothetical protein